MTVYDFLSTYVQFGYRTSFDVVIDGEQRFVEDVMNSGDADKLIKEWGMTDENMLAMITQ